MIDMSNLELLDFWQSLNFSRTQTKYAQSIFERFHMVDYQPLITPPSLSEGA
eukprot:c16719_g1_i1 orf=1-156(-)